MPPPAAIPHAPTLHAEGEDAIRVKWTLPDGLEKIGSFGIVSMKADDASEWLRVDCASGIIGAADALPMPLSMTECVVKGVDAKVKYVAKVRLGNQSGWGPDSAVSKPLQLLALRPAAPAAGRGRAPRLRSLWRRGRRAGSSGSARGRMRSPRACSGRSCGSGR